MHRRLRRILCGVLLSAAGTACGSSRTPPPDEPKVAAIEQVKDNLYVIKGGGGNTAALVTDAGVVLVDTKLRGWGQAILDQLRTVTDAPVTTIINTHRHADHVLGNLFFLTARDVVAQQNAREHMKELPAFQGEFAKYLPNRTYTDRLSLTVGHDRVDLYYFGPGHTGGDTIVVFPALRVAHTGDLFSDRVVPIIERVGGGSGLAYPSTLAQAASGIHDVDWIITGHGAALQPWAALGEYADFNRDFLAWTQAQFDAGRSAADAVQAFRMPERYKSFGDQWRAATNIRTIYDELHHEPARPFRPWWKVW